MPKNDSSNDVPFDLDTLTKLVEMMDRHGLTEISLRQADRKWKLRRGPQEVVQFQGMPPSATPGVSTSPVSSGSAEPLSTSAESSEQPGMTAITSPTVGTFYPAPNPDDPPFVSVGSQVQPDTIVCIVEAMKVFNQIPAEVSGTIVEALVNDGDPVEFGQPLFRVRSD